MSGDVDGAILAGMTTLLDKAVAQLRTRSPEQQDEVARLLLAYLGDEAEPYVLDADERRAVRAGLAEANQGEFVPEVELEAFWHRHEE